MLIPREFMTDGRDQPITHFRKILD